MPKSSEFIVDDDLRLYHLGVTAGEVAPNIVLVGDPARAERVAAHFACVDSEIRRREFVTLTGRFDDPSGESIPVSVVGTGIGTDNVEIALLEAYAALALDLETMQRRSEAPVIRVIWVGTSGGARPDLPAGTICIAKFALGLDSTGLYYQSVADDPIVDEIEQQAQALLNDAVLPGSRFAGRLALYAAPASRRIFNTLERRAQAADSAVASGITVSSPGFYGASSRFIDGLTNTVPDIKGTLAKLDCGGHRVLNFEMESSLLFHLSAALGIEAGTLCPAISQPGSHAEIPPYAPRIEICIGIALGALAELSSSSRASLE